MCRAWTERIHVGGWRCVTNLRDIHSFFKMLIMAFKMTVRGVTFVSEWSWVLPQPAPTTLRASVTMNSRNMRRTTWMEIHDQKRLWNEMAVVRSSNDINRALYSHAALQRSVCLCALYIDVYHKTICILLILCPNLGTAQKNRRYTQRTHQWSRFGVHYLADLDLISVQAICPIYVTKTLELQSSAPYHLRGGIGYRIKNEFITVNLKFSSYLRRLLNADLG